jgi:hypothetical protein
MNYEQPEISIVIGSKNARSTIVDCLKTLIAQVKGQSVEIIVADGSTDNTADVVASQFPSVMLIRSDAKHLLPRLWGLGITHARTPIVAITTGSCIPADDWVASILHTATTQTKAAGIGGAIAPPSGGSPIDWAVYFSRYSAFMPPVSAGSVAEIPGDNAVYRKTALERYWKQPENGFWETLFHHELRLQGENLYMSPDIEVCLGKTDHAWKFFQARFQHGRHYGSTRPDTSRVGRLGRALAAPALMPFLLLRIGQRVVKHRPDWLMPYLLALPWLVLFLSAWSLGEVSGYLWSQSYEHT